MCSRKRGTQEMEVDEVPREQDLLDQLRNMWEFANLSQWIYLFGRAVKISEDVNIEYIESECLKPDSTVLSDIGLALLKLVSSHRGLTPEIFDEYTRRQYIAKAPQRNPFGNEQESARFNDLDIFTKIRIIQQLTKWAMINPERIREKMAEHKDTEQVIWRTEKFGVDSQNRTYFVLADNRLYRYTDANSNSSRSKKVPKRGNTARRASKRAKTADAIQSFSGATNRAGLEDQVIEEQDDKSNETKWECIAITLEDYNSFLSSIKKTHNNNEKLLRARIMNDLIPLLEKQLEAQQRNRAQKERELLNLEKLACAKRSSRIADKLEQQRKQEEILSMERNKATELVKAKKEQEKWIKLEKERESRIVTREQRLREREARRILHEKELANLSGEKNSVENGLVRSSERHLKAEIQRKKQELEKLALEDDWIFDCICGSYGQIDDGTHSIACDKCNTWQHSKCVGVSKAEADRLDFTFICSTCQRRANERERANSKPSIIIKLNRLGQPLKTTKFEPEDTSKASPTPKNTTGSRDLHHTYSEGSQTPGGATNNRDNVGTSLPVIVKPLDFNEMSSRILKFHQASSGCLEDRRPVRALSVGAGSIDESQSSSVSNLPIDINHRHSVPPETLPHKRTQLNEKSSKVLKTPLISSQDLEPSFDTINTQSKSKNSQSESPLQTKYSPSKTLNQENSSSESQSYDTSQSRSIKSSRRSPPYFPSPFTSAPMLTPNQTRVQTQNYHAFDRLNLSDSPSQHETFSSPAPQTALLKNGIVASESHHASALLNTATGVSPVKISHPTSKILNGDSNVKTPTMLPPVACLTPSPQILNLSPPVKSSEPERPRSAAQNVSA